MRSAPLITPFVGHFPCNANDLLPAVVVLVVFDIVPAVGQPTSDTRVWRFVLVTVIMCDARIGTGDAAKSSHSIAHPAKIMCSIESNLLCALVEDEEGLKQPVGNDMAGDCCVGVGCWHWRHQQHGEQEHGQNPLDRPVSATRRACLGCLVPPSWLLAWRETPAGSAGWLAASSMLTAYGGVAGLGRECLPCGWGCRRLSATSPAAAAELVGSCWVILPSWTGRRRVDGPTAAQAATARWRSASAGWRRRRRQARRGCAGEDTGVAGRAGGDIGAWR